jgi:hypothetical protein
MMILERAENYVYGDLALDITTKVKNISEEMAVKATNSKLLVEFENELENIKNVKQQKLLDQYTDMVDWLMMLSRNPIKEAPDETNPIRNAYRQID